MVVGQWDVWQCLLELVKHMCALADAPFTFQACKGEFYIKELEAIRSRWDENFYWWISTPGGVHALATAHVDDNEMGTPRTPEG